MPASGRTIMVSSIRIRKRNHEVWSAGIFPEVYCLTFRVANLVNWSKSSSDSSNLPHPIRGSSRGHRQMLLEDELGWEFGTDEEFPGLMRNLPASCRRQK